MEMEWELRKARENERKHGVRFADVEPVFYDPHAITIEDHSSVEEQRFLTLGIDGFARVLVVTYTFRGEGIRIISARKASPGEVRAYEETT